jgi:hypothetical protein
MRFSAAVLARVVSFNQLTLRFIFNGPMSPTSSGWHTAVALAGTGASAQPFCFGRDNTYSLYFFDWPKKNPVRMPQRSFLSDGLFRRLLYCISEVIANGFALG